MTLSIMTFNIMSLSIFDLIVTNHNDIQHERVTLCEHHNF